MARTVRSRKTLQEICQRFATLVDDYLRMSDQEVAARLGYPSTSTLWKVRKREAFIDIERLCALAGVEVGNMRPNLDWLLTGLGSPLVTVRRQKQNLYRASAVLAGLSVEKQRAIFVLLQKTDWPGGKR